MARILTAWIVVLGLPTRALAHVGHLADVGGHDHVIAGIAIGIAIAIGLAGALAGARDDKDAEADDEDGRDPELSEA